MILQALCELAEAENLLGDPDFENKPVSWVVRLTKDGEFIQLEDRRVNLNEGRFKKNGDPVKAKWVGKIDRVPKQPGRTSGAKAFFLVDKAEYTLGLDPAGKRDAEELAIRRGLFCDYVAECHAETDRPDLAAVLTFLDRLKDQPVDLPDDMAGNDLVAFQVGLGSLVHRDAEVRSWWKAQRSSPVGDAEQTDTPPLRCLVSGHEIHGEVPNFPLIKRVPGGSTSGVGLVSFNTSAYTSYGLDGNANAPISRPAAEAAAIALNRLLNRDAVDADGEKLPARRIDLSPDTAVVFWAPHSRTGAANYVTHLIQADDPNEVADLYRSVWQGKPPNLKDPSHFYALTITGTQGRAVLRDWFETTVDDALASIALHFEHLSIVRNTRPAKGKPLGPAITLRFMLSALAAPGRDASVPPALATDILRATLDRRRSYPLSVLQRALLRERAEAGGDEWMDSARRDARAALIKAVLTRHFQLEITPAMDESNNDTGMRLGRLFAVLEDTQRLASGGVNASIKDKYYAAASATPAAVFPQLMSLFHKHARKARDAKPGAIIKREKLIDTILADVSDIPIHLDLKQQGLFILGYHQQRHALYHKPSNESPEPETETDA